MLLLRLHDDLSFDAIFGINDASTQVRVYSSPYNSPHQNNFLTSLQRFWPLLLITATCRWFKADFRQ